MNPSMTFYMLNKARVFGTGDVRTQSDGKTCKYLSDRTIIVAGYTTKNTDVILNLIL